MKAKLKNKGKKQKFQKKYNLININLPDFIALFMFEKFF